MISAGLNQEFFFLLPWLKLTVSVGFRCFMVNFWQKFAMKIISRRFIHRLCRYWIGLAAIWARCPRRGYWPVWVLLLKAGNWLTRFNLLSKCNIRVWLHVAWNRFVSVTAIALTFDGFLNLLKKLRRELTLELWAQCVNLYRIFWYHISARLTLDYIDLK